MPKRKNQLKFPSKNIFISFFPFFVAITLAYALIYVIVQQTYRQAANDPQIQLAEDTANSLSAGNSINPGAFDSKVDIDKSLAAFIMVFDKDGKLIASTAVENGEEPTFPRGAIKASDDGENRVTWQTAKGARSATVTVPFKNKTMSGYVMVGRSLKEVEDRIHGFAKIIGIAWIITLGATFISLVISKSFSK